MLKPRSHYFFHIMNLPILQKWLLFYIFSVLWPWLSILDCPLIISFQDAIQHGTSFFPTNLLVKNFLGYLSLLKCCETPSLRDSWRPCSHEPSRMAFRIAFCSHLMLQRCTNSSRVVKCWTKALLHIFCQLCWNLCSKIYQYPLKIILCVCRIQYKNKAKRAFLFSSEVTSSLQPCPKNINFHHPLWRLLSALCQPVPIWFEETSLSTR